MQQPNKKTTLRALMSNEEMAALINEAINSPVGSTPRKRAQKIVSIMKKVGAIDNRNAMQPLINIINNPEVMKVMEQSQQPAPKKAPAIFPAPPARRQNVNDGRGGMPDGKGGLEEDMLSGEYGVIGQAAGAANKYIPAGLKAVWDASQGAGEYVSQNTSQGLTDLYKGAVGKLYPFEGPGYTTYGETSGGSKLLEQMKNLKGNTTGASTPATSGNQSSKTQAFNPATSRLMNPFTGLLNVPGSKTASVVTGASNTQSDPTSMDYSGMFDEEDGTFSSLMSAMGINDYTSDPYKNVSNNKVKSALEGGLSASNFAYQMMNNPDELRKLPGFENVPDDALPYGASLSGQVGALAETLRKESGLDAMLDEYHKLLNSSGSLNRDLTDYIRGRDEYLNETQDLIDDFKDKTGKMDMANPVIAKRAKQYNDFLYTLKGRQNKRYIEFLNQSLETQQNNINNKKSEIETTLADLESKIDFQGNLAVDEYERIYSTLVDTYNVAASLPETELSRQTAQTELYKAVVQAVNDASGVADPTEYTAEYRKSVEDLSGIILDKETNSLLPYSRDINSLMMEYGGADSPIAGDYKKVIYDVWSRGMKADFFNSTGGAGEIMSVMNDYMKGLDNYLNTWGVSGVDASNNKTYYEDIVAQYSSLKNQVKASAVDALRSSLSSSSEAVGQLRTALKELSSKGIFGGYISRQDFVKKYSSTELPSTLLDTVYTVITNYVNSTTNKNPSETAWHVYSDVSKYKNKNPGIDNIPDQELIDNILSSIVAAGNGQTM